jgi:hypothetical protein
VYAARWHAQVSGAPLPRPLVAYPVTLLGQLVNVVFHDVHCGEGWGR